MTVSYSDATVLQHSGGEFRVGRGLIGAMEQSVTFETDSPLDFPLYARLGNTANHAEVEAVLATLHNGEDSIVFGSGMAAANATYFALLQPGDHVLAQENCYGGMHGFLTSVLARWNIEIEFVPVEQWPQRVKPNTRLAHFESITNPFCKPQNVAKICRELKAAHLKFSGTAKRPLLTVCDNTFASPILCKPLNLGADIVMESATKYLNGHSDVVCGAIIANREIIETIRGQSRLMGGFLPTQACMMLLRGLRTLEIRMKAHCETGAAFAKAMADSRLVNKVCYGTEDSEIKEIFSKGFGGMVTVKFAPTVDTIAMIAATRYIKNVPSLAGTETTATLPWYSTNRFQPDSEKQRLGISLQLVRFSVGIENVADIIEDVLTAAKNQQRN